VAASPVPFQVSTTGRAWHPWYLCSISTVSLEIIMSKIIRISLLKAATTLKTWRNYEPRSTDGPLNHHFGDMATLRSGGRKYGHAQHFTSPRLVRSVETVHHRGTLASIMELLSGRTLYDSLREPRSAGAPRKRVEWLTGITEGLAYLHERDIVHRDLSPRNCLFRHDGSLALGDFGVARRTDDYTLTTFHERMGSLIYISPQQRENPHSARFTDDVFALGQIAYHMLTGRSPHGGIEAIAALGYPAELDSWVQSCRDPDPISRPESATESLNSLKSLGITDASLPKTLSDIVV
jgi:serine/threonine protein kinase